MQFDTGSFISGLGGCLVGFGVLQLVVKDKFAQAAETAKRVQRLETERIAKIEREMDAIRDSGCAIGVKVLEKVENLLGWMKRVDGKLELDLAETNQHSARIEALTTWVKNLDDSHNTHTRDRGIHHG